MNISTGRWTDKQTATLVKLVAQHKREGDFVSFREIAMKVGRSSKSCKQKAYAMGLVFATRKKPEDISPKKIDMRVLPAHKSGEMVNYGGRA